MDDAIWRMLIAEQREALVYRERSGPQRPWDSHGRFQREDKLSLLQKERWETKKRGGAMMEVGKWLRARNSTELFFSFKFEVIGSIK